MLRVFFITHADVVVLEVSVARVRTGMFFLFVVPVDGLQQ